MTPTRGLPFSLEPGSASSSTASGSASSAASARCAATLTSPRRSASSTSPQSASSAGVHSTTRLCVAASGDSGAAGPDMSMTASCARGRKPAASTAAPRSTCVSPRPTGIAGPEQPGEHASPAGPLRAGLDGVQHADDPHGVAGRGDAQPDLGERGVAKQVEHALLADGEAPRVVARALAQLELAHLVDDSASAPSIRGHRSGSFQMSRTDAASARTSVRALRRPCPPAAHPMPGTRPYWP